MFMWSRELREGYIGERRKGKGKDRLVKEKNERREGEGGSEVPHNIRFLLELPKFKGLILSA